MQLFCLWCAGAVGNRGFGKGRRWGADSDHFAAAEHWLHAHLRYKSGAPQVIWNDLHGRAGDLSAIRVRQAVVSKAVRAKVPVQIKVSDGLELVAGPADYPRSPNQILPTAHQNSLLLLTCH